LKSNIVESLQMKSSILVYYMWIGFMFRGRIYRSFCAVYQTGALTRRRRLWSWRSTRRCSTTLWQLIHILSSWMSESLMIQ